MTGMAPEFDVKFASSSETLKRRCLKIWLFIASSLTDRQVRMVF
jgi:hypothetical protein